MNLVAVDDTPEGRTSTEHNAQAGPASRVHSDTAESRQETDENYWPMFWSSAQAALLTVVAEFAFTFYLALQWGIRVELRLWKNVLPYMAMNTQRPIFEDVVRLSSILTAVVLAIFSISAVLRRKRLQAQAGRAFAWIDISLIGLLNLSRAWWFDNALQPAVWMYALVLVGLVGFVVSSTLVKIDFEDRTNFEESNLENEENTHEENTDEENTHDADWDDLDGAVAA